MEFTPKFTLEEAIFWSLSYYDIVRWREFGRPEEYDLVAEQIAEKCWFAKDERELMYMIHHALADFCHPTTLPSVDSLEPIAVDIWNIRKDFKV